MATISILSHITTKTLNHHNLTTELPDGLKAIIQENVSTFQQYEDFRINVEKRLFRYPTNEDGAIIYDLDVEYKDCGAQVSRYYAYDEEDDRLLHSTGLQQMILDHETGEIIYMIYGINNWNFCKVLDSLISEGRKFNVMTLSDDGMKIRRQCYHETYKQYKSGKWRKKR